MKERKKRGTAALLTPEKLEEIIALRKAGLFLKDIASLTGISVDVVQKRMLIYVPPPPKKQKAVFELDRVNGKFSWKDWRKVAGHTI